MQELERIKENLTTRHESALQRVRDGEKAEAAAKALVAKARIELEILDALIAESFTGELRKTGNGSANGHTAYGGTTPAMITALKQLGGRAKLAAVTDFILKERLVADTDRAKVSNNVGSVFYRAIKNPKHPTFRQAGRGEVQLASFVEGSE